MRNQPRYDYHLVSLTPDYTLDSIMEKVGDVFEICIAQLGLPESDTIEAFLTSGLAEELERQNACFVNGMSGLELAEWMLLNSAFHAYAGKLPSECSTGLTAEHWIGKMVGYYQVTYGYKYRTIFAACPPKWLRGLALTSGEDTPSVIAKEIHELVQRYQEERPLRAYRKGLGLTQAELAEAIGVSTRIIQQYEQGQKSINHASGATLYRLSILFGCRMEDLLEFPCW